MKIFNILLISFIIIILILFGAGLYSVYNIKILNAKIEQTSLTAYPIHEHATNLEKGAHQLWIGTFIYTGRDIAFGKQNIKNGKKLMEESIEHLKDLNVPISEIDLKKKNVLAAQQKVIALVDENPAAKDKIEYSLNLLLQRISALNLDLSLLEYSSNEQLSSSIYILTVAKEQGDDAIKITFVSLIVSLLLSLTIAMISSNSITKPIIALSQSNEAIAAGEYRKAQHNKDHQQHNMPVELAEMIKTRQLMLKKLLENEKILVERKEKLEKLNTNLQKSYLKLKEYDEMKDDLISIVGHELQTPLTSILSLSQSIYDKEMGPLTKKQKKSLKIVLNDILRLRQLIKNTLDVTRLEAKKITYDLNVVNLLTLLDKSTKTVQSMANERKITIQFVRRERVNVKVDQQRIIQVTINLLTNAIKYGKKGGHIWISVFKKNGQAIVSVEDDGRGIMKKDLSKLFNKMYQTDLSAQRIAGGLGLGLYISRKIINDHNGQIWVTSEFGNGSTFYFSLPLEKLK